MGSILRPFQNLLASGQLQVPTGNLTIDWSHPLARGLVGAWIPGTMGGANLARTVSNLVAASPTSFDGMGPEGPGLNCTNASAASIANVGGPHLSTSDPLITAGAYSSYMRSFAFGAPGSNFGVITPVVDYTDPNVSPFVFWPLIQFNGSNSALRVLWNANGASASNGLSTTLSQPGVYSVGLAYSIAGGQIFSYFNGVQDPTVQSPTSGPNASTGNNYIEFGAAINAVVYCAYMWTRQLTAAEMAWVHQYPYDFLIPAEYELPSMSLPPIGPTLWAQTLM